MAPAFHARRLAGYGDTMVRLTERMLASWRPEVARDVHAEMMALTLGIVATVGLGVGLMWLVYFSHRRGYDDEAGGDGP